MFARSQFGRFIGGSALPRLAAVFALFALGCESRSAAVAPSEHSTQAATASDSTVSSASSTASPIPVSSNAPSGPSASSQPDLPLLDFATLPANAKSLNGKRVRVIGEVFAGAFILAFDKDGKATSFSIESQTCTELECSDDNPCCNRCNSAVSLRGKDLMGVTLVAPRVPQLYGCSGNNCSLECSPKAGRYEATGVLFIANGNEVQLRVDSMTAL